MFSIKSLYYFINGKNVVKLKGVVTICNIYRNLQEAKMFEDFLCTLIIDLLMLSSQRTLQDLTAMIETGRHMPNKFQLTIYRLSIASPAMFIIALVRYQEKHALLVPLLFVGIGLLSIILLWISFKYAKRHVALISINAIEVSPADKWLFSYVLSYLFPFASIAFPDFDPLVTPIISLIAIFVLPLINSQSPNPLLFISGYHFFTVKTTNGIREYILLSKQKMRNANQITYVKRLFEYLLVDERR